MDWSKPWRETEPAPEKKNRKKWNYVFWESLKMALFLPAVILFTEIFILDIWPDFREEPMAVVYDYVFLFSVIFLIFVLFHIIRWRKVMNNHKGDE